MVIKYSFACGQSNTAKNTIISPNFLMWKFWKSPGVEILRKLCVSTKFLRQEIRRNYGGFCSGTSHEMQHNLAGISTIRDPKIV